MVIESYRYRAAAEFALAMKADSRPGEMWLMLHEQFVGGEEYIVADEEGAKSVKGTHKVIGSSRDCAVGDRQ